MRAFCTVLLVVTSSTLGVHAEPAITVKDPLDAAPAPGWLSSQVRDSTSRFASERRRVFGTFAQEFASGPARFEVTWFDRERVGNEAELRRWIGSFLSGTFDTVTDAWRWADGAGQPGLLAAVTDANGARWFLVIEHGGLMTRTSVRDAAGHWRFGIQRGNRSLLFPCERPEGHLPKLTSADPEVRRQAVTWLGSVGVGDVAVGRALIPLLGDADADTRRLTAWSLATVGVPLPDVPRALVRALEDPDRFVRLQSAQMLDRFPAQAEELIPPLLAVGRDSNRELAEAACAAAGELARAGDPALADRALTPFVAWLGDSNARIRLSALRGLDHMIPRAKAAMEPVAKLRSDPDEAVRKQAATVLRVLKEVHGDPLEGNGLEFGVRVPPPLPATVPPAASSARE